MYQALNSSFSSGASKWRGRKRGNQCELSGSSADEDSLDEDEVTTGILKGKVYTFGQIQIILATR